MKPLSRHLRSLATSSVLAAVALAAPVASAQDVLVDKSEIRFVAKQLGVNVDGRFRKWKANVVFLPADLAKSKAEFDIDLASIDLASEGLGAGNSRRAVVRYGEVSRRPFLVDVDQGSGGRQVRDRRRADVERREARRRGSRSR
jgi:polyisoprenoid-binding protein YceI